MKRNARNTLGEQGGEILAGLGSVIAGALVGFLALHVGMGLLNAASAAFLAYVLAVITAVCNFPLHPGRVVAYSVRGSIATVVVAGIVLIGFMRAFRGIA